MNPKLNELKLEKSANFSFYDWVLLIVKEYSHEWEELTWIDVQNRFRKQDIKCDCLLSKQNIYFGLIFNNFLLSREDKGERKYPLYELYKVDRTYYKYNETVGKYDLFNKVNKEEVKGETFYICKGEK